MICESKGEIMDILVISDTKLKIMLERADMARFGLQGDQISYDDPPTRKKLLTILDRVKAESGFDTASDKLLLQLYPSKDGGSELFVTKLGPLSPSAEQSLKRSRGVGIFLRGTEIFFTKNHAALVSIARALEGVETIECSRLYHEDSEGYYLVLEQRSGAGALSPLLPALEFADPIHVSLQPYIEEYASLLIGENALAALLEAPGE